MRFRFTISRDPAALNPFPDITTWEQSSLGSADAVLPWSDVGTPNPTISFVGATIFPVTSSQFLFTEYDFVPGWLYRIEVTITHTDDEFGPTNPRTLSMRIKDEFYGDIFSESHATTAGTDTYAIEFTATSDCKVFALRYISGSDRTITIDDTDNEITPAGDGDSIVINEPDGWPDARLKLQRDPSFHSLVEFFDSTFIFYGSNGEVDGGYETIIQWEKEGGPDAAVKVLIEYDAYDENNWITLFEGLFDLSLLIDQANRTVRLPIVREDFWAKFMNRRNTPVNLISEIDLDGEDVQLPVSEISIDLPAQKIRYTGEYRWQESFMYEFTEYNQHYAMQVDWDQTVIDDIKKFNLPRAMVLDPENDGVDTGESVVGLFEAPWDGEYTFDIRIELAFYDDDDDEWRSTAQIHFWLHRVDELQSVENRFDRTFDSAGGESWNIHTFNKTLYASKGQQFKVYGTFAGVVTSGDLPRYTVFGERRLAWRDVALATTNSITLSGEQTIDGTMTSSTRVLVRNQGDASLNGVYVSGAGAWTRATDSDTEAELIDAAVYVTGGTDNVGTGWRQLETEIDLGSTAVTWAYMQPTDERRRPYPGTQVENYFNVVADTTFRKTRTSGFLLHDAGAAITKQYGLGYPNPFYSETLGSEKTLARQYEENGCNWAYGVTRGLQLRGFSLADKQFAMSFMEWWNGADPILNLGLGYEFIPESTVIPQDAEVAALIDWENAGGPHPGTWSYTSPDVPHVSVNGSDGVSGYAKGACLTEAGSTYYFEFELEIFDTGVSGEEATITVAILDAFDNEIETEEFHYTVAGVKTETVVMTPSIDGFSVGIRITNNTPFDTKNFQINAFESVADLTPVVTDEERRIRVEKREFFFNPEKTVLLSNINDIERSYDTAKMFKKVVIGYREWKTEDISGIDDPQTKHTYASTLKRTGEEVEILSEFIGASLAIEQTRRQSIDLTTDYQYDDSTFIIALNPDYESESSPDLFIPETDENFVAINNLLNSETRYNIRITTARNFLRHENWLYIGLQPYVGTNYKFTRGEGNYDLETQMIAPSPDLDCGDEYDGDLLAESQNFEVTNECLHSAHYYTITDYPLSVDDYITIRDNRNNAIGISQTDENHATFFIDELTFNPVTAVATISGWTTERLDLIVVESLAPTSDCTLALDDDCPGDALTDEFGEVITDELGECIYV